MIIKISQKYNNLTLTQLFVIYFLIIIIVYEIITLFIMYTFKIYHINLI